MPYGERNSTQAEREPLSDTMYLLISFGKSTPLQNRQLHIFSSYKKQYVDDFVGELTFPKTN